MKASAILWAAVTAVWSFTPARATEPAPTPLEPIVVTATRSGEATNRLPAAVTVITRDQILSSGARHLVDVLRASGVAQVTDFYGDGSRAQLDLRGFGEGAHGTTLVLVNGRRINNPDIATPDLNSIALHDIERIEIIEGSAGALYGDQAVGGVINIITRDPADATAEGAASAASFDGVGVQLRANGRRADTALRLSGEFRRADNYRDHNRLEYANIQVGGEHALSGGARLFADAGHVDERLQTPGALYADEVEQDRRQSTANFRNDFSDTRTTSARLGALLPLGAHWHLEAEATHRRSDGDFRLSFTTFPAAQDSRQDREVTALTPRLVGRFGGARGETLVTAGVDLQEARYLLASQLGVQRNDQAQRDAYLQAVIPATRDIEATLGGRIARVENEVVDGFTFTTPTRFGDRRTAVQAGLAWRPLPGVRVFARHDANYRFAKVDEFTNAGAPAGSNQNRLETQSGQTHEAGADWDVHGWSGMLTVFRLEQQREIAFDPASFTNINLPETRRVGQRLTLRWEPTANLRLRVGYQHVDAAVRRGGFAGRDIPLVAAHTGGAGADIHLPRDFALHLEWVGTGDRVLAGDFDNTLPRLPGHGLVNAALTVARNRWHWSVRLDNLLDNRISEYGAAGFDAGFNEAPTYFPSPGVRGSARLRYEF